MFPTLARRLATSRSVAPKLGNATKSTPPRTYADAIYRPKKVWPPDFSKLSQKEQFRLEKRHKRRVRLATARPRWDRYVRLVQVGTMVVTLVYTVLFMEWNTKNQPLERIRNSFWSAIGAISGKQHERRRPDLSTTADEK